MREKLFQLAVPKNLPEVRHAALTALARDAADAPLSEAETTKVLSFLKDSDYTHVVAPAVHLLERTDLHHRLINGSDYPLPAINVVIQTRALVKYGLLSRDERSWLNEIYDYNPLLFDYAVKRTIRHPESGSRFPASVFTGSDLGPAFSASSPAGE